MARHAIGGGEKKKKEAGKNDEVEGRLQREQHHRVATCAGASHVRASFCSCLVSPRARSFHAALQC